jgi:hypothetical protein
MTDFTPEQEASEKAERERAAREGKVSFVLFVWDGADKRFGGAGACFPEEASTILRDLGASAGNFITHDEGAREKLGWTPPGG